MATLKLAHCTVDLDQQLVHRAAGGDFVLRELECRLLAHLARNPGRPVPRSELLSHVWGYSPGAQSRTVDVTVRRLREKIADDGDGHRHIHTVRGVGYRFDPLPGADGLALPVGEIGSVTVGPVIGRGHLSVVMEGFDSQRNVDVAVKVFTGAAARTSGFSDRLRQIQTQLNDAGCPEILTTYTVGELTTKLSVPGVVIGSPVAIMERAVPLAHDSPLPSDEVVAVLRACHRALVGAHEAGALHLDIKPRNVMSVARSLGRPDTVLADFGVVRVVDTEGLTDQLLGTPAYMAPEQFEASTDVDVGTDIYALGCLAFRLLTGDPPFGRLPPWRAMMAHRTAPRPELPPDIAAPKGLGRWIATAMAVAPSDRFPSAAVALRELEELVR